MNKTYLVAGLIFLVSACASRPDIYIDYNGSHSFKAYKTFSWAHQPPLIRTGDIPVSSIIENRVTQALRLELQSKGFSFVSDASDSDFLVAFTMGARENVEIYQQDASVYENKDNWLWGKEYHSYYFDMVLPEDLASGYTKGVISIDIFDRKSRAPVWHGKASKSLTQAEISSDGGSAAEAIALILTKFPPRN